MFSFPLSKVFLISLSYFSGVKLALADNSNMFSFWALYQQFCFPLSETGSKVVDMRQW